MFVFHLLRVNCIALLASLFLKTEVLGSEVVFQTIQTGYQLKENIIANHSVQSSIECGQYCLQKQRCVAFSFKSSQTTFIDPVNCKLSSSEVLSHFNDTTSNAAGWSIYQLFMKALSGSYKNPGKSCLDIGKKRKRLPLRNGEYWITVDSSGPLKVFCDMTTDGGGWTLVSKIVYQKEQSKFKWSVQNDFRKISEFKTGTIVLTPQALGKLRNQMSFNQLRFNCLKQSPNRTIDIATRKNGLGMTVVDYFTFKNSFPTACRSFYLLNDDNSKLASGDCSKWGKNGHAFGRWSDVNIGRKNRLVEHVMFIPREHYWNVPTRDAMRRIERWECDDYATQKGFKVSSGDFWKIFVR